MGLKTAMLEALYNEILSNSNTYYYFLGRSLPWSYTDEIEEPFNSARYENLTRSECVFMKKVNLADISFIVKRYDWSPRIFDQYDDCLGEYVTHPDCSISAGEGNFNNKIIANDSFDASKIPLGSLVSGPGIATGARVIAVSADEIAVSLPHTSTFEGITLTFTNVAYSGASSLEQAEFYCVTSDLNVYKCISNNNNAISTVKPYGATFNLLKMEDGYIWKYMYTISTSFVNKFVTPTDIPVTTALSNQYYSRGSINSVTSLSYGSGYVGASLIVNGDGRLKDNPLMILSANIDNEGTDYDHLNPPLIEFQDPFLDVEIFLTETEYSLGTKVKVLDSSLIYEVISPGTTGNFYPNHTSDDLVVNGTTVLKFVGKTLKGNAVVDEDGKLINVILNGMIGYVNLSNQGSGYSTDKPPVVTFTSGNAKAVAEVVDGKVTRIKITDRGVNYSSQTSVIIEPPHSGKMVQVDVINGGEYTSIPSVIITSPNDGNPATAESVMEINAVSIVDGGSGWSVGDTFNIKLNDTNSTSAICEVANVIDGSVTQINIVDSGLYDQIDPLTNLLEIDAIKVVSENGTGLKVSTTLAVKILRLTNVGNGYSYEDLVGGFIPVMIEPGISDALANGVADVIRAGDVTATANATIFYGWGYSTTPQVLIDSDNKTASISIVAQKTSADIRPIVNNGQITGVIINDPGIGYTAATIEVDATSFVDEAVLIPNLSLGDLDTRQSNVELLAIPGTIDSIVIINPGSNYSSGSVSVTIEGDGTGCTIDLSDIKIEDGAIKQIIVTNPGRNYTYANVIINGGDGVVSPAYARAVISPIKGHGSNAVRELCAQGISFTTSFTLERNQGIKVDNEYRQLGIIRNPLKFNSLERYTALNGSTCYNVTAPFNLDYIKNDDLLWTSPSTSANKFRVISIPSNQTSASKSILILSLGSAVLDINDQLFYKIDQFLQQNTDRGYAFENDEGFWESVVVEGIIKPNIDKYSGEMMLIDNRASFQPTSRQNIAVKTAIRL